MLTMTVNAPVDEITAFISTLLLISAFIAKPEMNPAMTIRLGIMKCFQSIMAIRIISRQKIDEDANSDEMLYFNSNPARIPALIISTIG